MRDLLPEQHLSPPGLPQFSGHRLHICPSVRAQQAWGLSQPTPTGSAGVISPCLTGSVRSHSSCATYLSVSIPSVLFPKTQRGQREEIYGRCMQKELGGKRGACGHTGLLGKRGDEEAFGRGSRVAEEMVENVEE